ncbi:MAG: hypothetical protein ACI9ZT_000606 [Gammaproteobacteria bacterium]|jgi:hypothetical protein
MLNKVEIVMNKQTIVLLLASVLMASCAASNQAVAVGDKQQEYLHIYPDGTMKFNGRIMNEEDVIIYDNGRGGEYAAVKLVIPRHSNVFRNSIVVERKVVEVLVAQQ